MNLAVSIRKGLRGCAELLGPILSCACIVVATFFFQPSAETFAGSTNSPPQSVASTVAGRVIEAQGRNGISNAIVRIAAAADPVPAGRVNPQPTFSEAVATDDQGRFAFRFVPSGMYTLTVTKQGYLDGSFGKLRYSDAVRPFHVSSTGRTDLDVVLWRASALSGRVVDDAGEPVVGQRVAVFRRQYVSGHRRFTHASTLTTDDRGNFRASLLVPGEYTACAMSVQKTVPVNLVDAYTAGQLSVDTHLRRQMTSFGSDFPKPGDANVRRVRDVLWVTDSVPIGSDSSFVNRMTCAPQSADLAAALVVSVGPGETGDLGTLPMLPVKGVRVQGVVENADSVPAHIVPRLLSKGVASLMTDAGFETAVAMTDSRGQFVFAGVPAGIYRLEASLILSDRSAAPSGSALRWIDQELAIGDTDVDGLRFNLRPGFQVSGSIALEGEIAKGTPDLSRYAVRLEPVDGRPRALPVATPASNGAFVFRDVPPGHYFLRGRLAPPDWHVKSALIGKLDVADEAFELTSRDVTGIVVTYSNRPSGIQAVVRDRSGSAAPDATVYAITAERKYWTDFGWAPRRLRWIRVDDGGRAQLTGLPPGSYYVSALSQSELDQTQGIEGLLEVITRRNQQLEIKEGELRSVTLTVSNR